MNRLTTIGGLLLATLATAMPAAALQTPDLGRHVEPIDVTPEQARAVAAGLACGVRRGGSTLTRQRPQAESCGL